MLKDKTQGRAPARLDILGGIADYSGSLVIEAPLDIHTTVTLDKRSDQMITIHSEHLYYELDLSLILPDRGKIVDSGSWVESSPPTWSLYVLGCLFVLLDEFDFDPIGLDIEINSEIPIGSGLSSSAALEIAISTWSLAGEHSWT